MNADGLFQLNKLIVMYCQYSGSSRGVRKFLREGITGFANTNPHIGIEARCVIKQNPKAIAYYANKARKIVDLKNCSPHDVGKVCQDLRNTSGRRMTQIKNIRETHNPSVQGEWRFRAGVKSNVKIEGDL